VRKAKTRSELGLLDQLISCFTEIGEGTFTQETSWQVHVSGDEVFQEEGVGVFVGIDRDGRRNFSLWIPQQVLRRQGSFSTKATSGPPQGSSQSASYIVLCFTETSSKPLQGHPL